MPSSVPHVQIVSREECEGTYPHQITRNMVCAGHQTEGEDASEGDSGGPLYVEASSRASCHGVTSPVDPRRSQESTLMSADMSVGSKKTKATDPDMYTSSCPVTL